MQGVAHQDAFCLLKRDALTEETACLMVSPDLSLTAAMVVFALCTNQAYQQLNKGTRPLTLVEC